MVPVLNSQPEHFEIARQVMIDSQIHPMGVVSESLLAAFMDVPRDMFVPLEMQHICYCDEDVPIASGRYMMEPSVLARMIQALEPKSEHVALTIGTGMGYDTAVLSRLVSTVVALEEDVTLLGQAQSTWDNLSYCNIVAVTGPQNAGAPVNAPYDIVMINGAVADIPLDIKQQLNIGGRLVAPVKKAGQAMAKVTLVERVKEDSFSETVLFDSGTPYLNGFEPKPEFIF